MRCSLAGAAVLGLALLAPAPALGFSEAILRSVVSVLPEWPSAARRPEEPEGSGVAVLSGGLIATNDHVLGSARHADVRLADGRVLEAEIVGRDRLTDIALLRVGEEVPVPAIGPTPALGAPVCAVGNQFGLGLSVTCGVVSALGRTDAGFNRVEDFLQTDAAVNPGASGGALVDADGRLVGLLSAIFTKNSDANIGVNFATSTALLMRVSEDLRDHGRVRRGRIGLVTEALGPEALAERTGVRVARVLDGSPAMRAGLALGDEVYQAGERSVRAPRDLLAAVQIARIGTRLVVKYRRGAEHRESEIAIEEWRP